MTGVKFIHSITSEWDTLYFLNDSSNKEVLDHLSFYETQWASVFLNKIDLSLLLHIFDFCKICTFIVSVGLYNTL